MKLALRDAEQFVRLVADCRFLLLDSNMIFRLVKVVKAFTEWHILEHFPIVDPSIGPNMSAIHFRFMNVAPASRAKSNAHNPIN